MTPPPTTPVPPLDWQTRERLTLAPWAMHAADSVGRVHPEAPHPVRSPYQRDRDRIVHSAAFRRLAHKTQVFTGYHGEDTLAELLRDEGGFSHNAQALRIMEFLEKRYAEFPGLNLSREALDAQATRKKDGTAPAPLLETQVVDAADSIAYDTHDADDAVELKLVTMEELIELPLVAEAAARVADRFGRLDGTELRHTVLHELVDMQVA